jgi:hypothetical protein
MTQNSFRSPDQTSPFANAIGNFLMAAVVVSLGALSFAIFLIA